MPANGSDTSLDLVGEPDPLTYSWRNVSVYYSRSTKAIDVPILKGGEFVSIFLFFFLSRRRGDVFMFLWLGEELFRGSIKGPVCRRPLCPHVATLTLLLLLS